MAEPYPLAFCRSQGATAGRPAESVRRGRLLWPYRTHDTLAL